jgi:hypothetical protein
MAEQKFTTVVSKASGRVFVPVPFDPAAVWGEKDRYHVTGLVNGFKIRGALEAAGASFRLSLGPAWLRDSGVEAGQSVEVTLAPEGPQQGNMGDDVERALAAEPSARRFFEALPTFYRKNYMRWVDSAKRPETRAKRVQEMVGLLKQGRRER